MEIWEPKPPGTLWATLGMLRDCFSFFPFLLLLLRSLFKENCDVLVIAHRRFGPTFQYHHQGVENPKEGTDGLSRSVGKI